MRRRSRGSKILQIEGHIRIWDFAESFGNLLAARDPRHQIGCLSQIAPRQFQPGKIQETDTLILKG